VDPGKAPRDDGTTIVHRVIDEGRIPRGFPDVVVVSLVYDDVGSRGNSMNEGNEVIAPCQASRGVCRIADIDQSGQTVDAIQHYGQVVGVLLVKRYSHDFGPAASGKIRH